MQVLQITEVLSRDGAHTDALNGLVCGRYGSRILFIDGRSCALCLSCISQRLKSSVFADHTRYLPVQQREVDRAMKIIRRKKARLSNGWVMFELGAVAVMKHVVLPIPGCSYCYEE